MRNKKKKEIWEIWINNITGKKQENEREKKWNRKMIKAKNKKKKDRIRGNEE